MQKVQTHLYNLVSSPPRHRWMNGWKSSKSLYSWFHLDTEESAADAFSVEFRHVNWKWVSCELFDTT